MREAIERALADAEPLPGPLQLRGCGGALSDRYGVPGSRIAIGNGSCDILLAAGEALLEPGRRARLRVALLLGLSRTSAPPPARARSRSRSTRAERHDLQAMLREITVATRLVIVCNPNNPTSTALPLADIAGFLAEVPRHVCVIVDEAYCEFNLLEDPDASIELLERHPNLVLLRTFSKVHGLVRPARRLRAVRLGGAAAGARPGAPAVLLQRARPGRRRRGARPPGRGRSDRVTRTVAERISVDERLRALGLEPADSQANFCWVRPRRGARRGRRSWRACSSAACSCAAAARSGRRAPALRVTYGLPEENARFLDALAEVLARPRALSSRALTATASRRDGSP